MADHPDGAEGEYQPREHDHLVEPMIAALDDRSSAREPARPPRGCALWIAALLAPFPWAGLGLVATARHAPAQSVTGTQGGGFTGLAPSPRVPQPAGVRAVHASGQTFVTWLERPELQGESYRIYRAPFPIHDVRASGVVDLDQRPGGLGRVLRRPGARPRGLRARGDGVRPAQRAAPVLPAALRRAPLDSRWTRRRARGAERRGPARVDARLPRLPRLRAAVRDLLVRGHHRRPRGGRESLRRLRQPRERLRGPGRAAAGRGTARVPRLLPAGVLPAREPG